MRIVLYLHMLTILFLYLEALFDNKFNKRFNIQNLEGKVVGGWT